MQSAIFVFGLDAAPGELAVPLALFSSCQG